MQGFSIPRCFKPKDFGEVKHVELHHFADASQEHGYGTASYLRLVNSRGQIHCCFVMGKSRVKPLKSAVTVPKLELTAATLATKVNKVITRELEGRLKIKSVTYWTDSMIVLKYIANEVRRFVTFVANWVAVIRIRIRIRIRSRAVAACTIRAQSCGLCFPRDQGLGDWKTGKVAPWSRILVERS